MADLLADPSENAKERTRISSMSGKN